MLEAQTWILLWPGENLRAISGKVSDFQPQRNVDSTMAGQLPFSWGFFVLGNGSVLCLICFMCLPCRGRIFLRRLFQCFSMLWNIIWRPSTSGSSQGLKAVSPGVLFRLMQFHCVSGLADLRAGWLDSWLTPCWRWLQRPSSSEVATFSRAPACFHSTNIWWMATFRM